MNTSAAPAPSMVLVYLHEEGTMCLDLACRRASHHDTDMMDRNWLPLVAGEDYSYAARPSRRR